MHTYNGPKLDQGMNIAFRLIHIFFSFLFFAEKRWNIATSTFQIQYTPLLFSLEIAVSPVLPGHSGHVIAPDGPTMWAPCGINYDFSLEQFQNPTHLI